MESYDVSLSYFDHTSGRLGKAFRSLEEASEYVREHNPVSADIYANNIESEEIIGSTNPEWDGWSFTGTL
jgi:hypothetical protein